MAKRFDRAFFHKLALIPLFALIGLGADPLSSSCYGPEEAFLALGQHPHLIVFVALLAIATIWILSFSYCQIIELFPHGGGGYVVASKLLSPQLGVVSGCALLVDYVLTITISIASGVDAIFSFLPLEFLPYKYFCKIAVLVFMTGLNVRGVKESVYPWVPIFLLFAITHLIAFSWAFVSHADEFQLIAHGISIDIYHSQTEFGLLGTILIILKSYSVGAGTYTGIEAVSNGLTIIQEPRVKNAKTTMTYMAIALAIAVSGLVVSYLIYHVQAVPGMTLNGVLLHKIGAEMGPVLGQTFATVTLLGEAAILIMAAQSGFLDGPRVLASMAADNWIPSKFTNVSDRFVLRHGLLMMSLAGLFLMIYTEGNVSILVILYSLSVFITFSLSQLGMTAHWAKELRFNRPWLKGLLINGVGFGLTLLILISLTLLKFEEGAWLTLTVIAALVYFCSRIRYHYRKQAQAFATLSCDIPPKTPSLIGDVHLDTSLHTAAIFVGGLQSLALNCVERTIKLFGNSIDHFVFAHVAIIDAGAFKGEEEINLLEEHAETQMAKLVTRMKQLGYSAEAVVAIGTDIGDESARLAKKIHTQHPSAIFLAGQLVFKEETYLTRLMHNHTLEVIQRRLYELGYSFVTIPLYV